MENKLRIKQLCPNCGRVSYVTDLTIGGTLLFNRQNWRCNECKMSYDIKIWKENENGYIYQQLLGSIHPEEYQKYNNQKIKLHN